MELDIKFWLQILTTIVAMGSMYGKIASEFGAMKMEIKWMKEKLDKHNSFQDRMVRTEESAKSAHKRLDELCEQHRG